MLRYICPEIPIPVSALKHQPTKRYTAKLISGFNIPWNASCISLNGLMKRKTANGTKASRRLGSYIFFHIFSSSLKLASIWFRASFANLIGDDEQLLLILDQLLRGSLSLLNTRQSGRNIYQFVTPPGNIIFYSTPTKHDAEYSR